MLRKDLPLVMGLIAAELRTPALTPAEFNKAKQEFIGALQASAQTRVRVPKKPSRAPFSRGASQSAAYLEGICGGRQERFARGIEGIPGEIYGPAHFSLSLAGDVGTKKYAPKWARYLADGAAAKTTCGRRLRPWQALRPRCRCHWRKAQHLGDFGSGLRTALQRCRLVAVARGTTILGLGFTGRLMSTVRDQEGLTYNIGAAVSDDTIADGPGYFSDFCAVPFG